jgi:hypothetical protein
MQQGRSRSSIKNFPQSIAVADGINWAYRSAMLLTQSGNV